MTYRLNLERTGRHYNAVTHTVVEVGLRELDLEDSLIPLIVLDRL